MSFNIVIMLNIGKYLRINIYMSFNIVIMLNIGKYLKINIYNYLYFLFYN